MQSLCHHDLEPIFVPNSLPRRRGAVAVIERDQRLLVIRRSEFVSAPLKYCFPGGRLEPGETAEQAVVRELREELQLDIRPVVILWRNITPWNVELTWWSVHVDGEAEPIPNPAEVHSFHWFSPHELRSLVGLLDSNLEFLRHWF